MDEEIKDALAHSTLTSEENEELFFELRSLPESILKPVLSLFVTDPAFISEFYKNFLLKKEAFALNDNRLFEKIISEEIESLIIGN